MECQELLITEGSGKGFSTWWKEHTLSKTRNSTSIIYLLFLRLGRGVGGGGGGRMVIWVILATRKNCLLAPHSHNLPLPPPLTSGEALIEVGGPAGVRAPKHANICLTTPEIC
jgi:hypothetical protein